ncbi:mitochondrial carrier [Xylona heveae TC161]|uniref:Mitochondrial thiamine pyrophosphate carrier 1 n=1 Tax=Xylona heveae (strain CBS 132557 / TC161) TaxID=1328760 RepID=A0A165H9K8_XYLHT|nr:mitochondrial carrier [Xylona heveae TC161]KZF23176.1 mitochondrial carrier [Xylona heveae TC161]
MPPTLADYGSSSPPKDGPREMSTFKTVRRNKDDPATCSTDEDSIPTKGAQEGRKSDKRSLDYAMRSGLAGGLAGCAAKTVVGPLDRVKILFQASNPQFMKYTGSWTGLATALRDIYSTSGMRGLFRGHSATLLRVFPYAAIKFIAYEQIRAVLIQNKSQETPGRRLISGSLAGITSVFFTYPLEVIRVRLAFETKQHSRSSLSSICRQIYNEVPHSSVASPSTSPSTATPPSAAASTARHLSSSAAHHHNPLGATAAAASSSAQTASASLEGITTQRGLANFFRGFSPTLVGMLPYAGMSFLTHDYAGDVLRHNFFEEYTTIPGTADPARHKSKQLKYWAELAAGGLAGLVSQTASYPFEVIRRRMQVGGAVGDGHRLRMTETARLIWAERGFRGFWIGLTIGYLKVVPMVATSFFVYERGKYWLGI